MFVRVVDNSKTNLATVLEEAFSKASQARFAVAFLSLSGVSIIERWLDDLLQRGGDAEFLVGLDFHTTAPEALRHLWRKQQQFDRYRLICFRGKETYHPKLYLFREENGLQAIVGSSNLTEGGLRANVEVNVMLDFPNAEDETAQALLDFYTRLKFSQGCFVPDEAYIEQYARVAERVRATRKAADADAVKDLAVREKALPQVVPSARDLSGWQRLVYSRLPTGKFATSDLYAFVPEFQKAYPENANIEAKIRQVLQQLRDLGLVHHLGRGEWQLNESVER
ncbi:NgoFVII family restriction endonuclease [Candidatus Parcubacteria bacterium]|nr:MAG: NgoFVII family restriction endonuclease [Candidatus Parcubacteria bacterium]